MEQQPTSTQIIQALGGPGKLATTLGLNRHTVQAWKKRGIPPKIQLEHPKVISKGKRLALLNMAHG